MMALLQIPMLAVIITITLIHAKRFAENKAIGVWFHFTWGCVYFIPAAFLCWQMGSYWLAGAFCLERFVFYNFILNIIRKEKFFYLHAGVNGSWWDDLELLWVKAYPWFWAASVLGFIAIQFYL